MERIEIISPDPQRALPILRDALDRQKRILEQSIAHTEKKIAQLAASLQVDPKRLLCGEVAHPEERDMDLLELEGELEILRHLREQLESLEQLNICA